MAKIDVYVISVMVFSLCVILFKSGMIRHKWTSMNRNERIFDIFQLLPYLSAVVCGVFLIITKEVVL